MLITSDNRVDKIDNTINKNIGKQGKRVVNDCLL